jgi:hypothetical protein
MKIFISIVLSITALSLGIVHSFGAGGLSILLIALGMFVVITGNLLKAILEAPNEFASFPILGPVLMSIGLGCNPLFQGFSENSAAALGFIWAIGTSLMIAEPMKMTEWAASASLLKRFGVLFFLIGGSIAVIDLFAYAKFDFMMIGLVFGLTALATFATATHKPDGAEPSEIRSKELGRFFDIKA